MFIRYILKIHMITLEKNMDTVKIFNQKRSNRKSRMLHYQFKNTCKKN